MGEYEGTIKQFEGKAAGTAMRIDNYKQLRVYQVAFEVAMRIFECSKLWPQEEKYGLTDQIRRSSRGICSSIGEAWFKWLYPKHFVGKLSDASSEAADTLMTHPEQGCISPAQVRESESNYFSNS